MIDNTQKGSEDLTEDPCEVFIEERIDGTAFTLAQGSREEGGSSVFRRREKMADITEGGFVRQRKEGSGQQTVNTRPASAEEGAAAAPQTLQGADTEFRITAI